MIFFLYTILALFTFMFFLMLFLPLSFLSIAIMTLINAPVQLFYLLAHPEVRKNHALEHATIHVLEELVPVKLSGVSNPNGFVIQGVSDPYLVLQAAHEAKRRLLSGEKDLAVHPRCGTTSVVTGLVFAILFIVFSILFGLFSFVNLLLSLVLGAILGSVLSPWVQRYVTTDWRVHDVEIENAELIIRGWSVHGVFVHTRKGDIKWSIR